MTAAEFDIKNQDDGGGTFDMYYPDDGGGT